MHVLTARLPGLHVIDMLSYTHVSVPCNHFGHAQASWCIP